MTNRSLQKIPQSMFTLMTVVAPDFAHTHTRLKNAIMYVLL